jgi:ribosome-interacting GTPase 1
MSDTPEKRIVELERTVSEMRNVLHQARDLIACVDCEEGLTVDDLIETIDKSLGTGTVILPDSAPPISKPSLDLAGRIYGLQEAAVIAGKTSIGLAIYERIKFLEANIAEVPR